MPDQNNIRPFKLIPAFQCWIRLWEGAEAITENEFVEIVARGADKEYARGKWPLWRQGPLTWLACRSRPGEVGELWALVEKKAGLDPVTPIGARFERFVERGQEAMAKGASIEVADDWIRAFIPPEADDGEPFLDIAVMFAWGEHETREAP